MRNVDKFKETGSRMAVARGGEGDWQLMKGYRVLVLQDEKILELGAGHDGTAVRLYLMPPNWSLKKWLQL